MIILYAKIDFFPQQRRVDGDGTARLLSDLRALAESYGGAPFGREDPFTASFDERNGFHAIQCVEALSAAERLLAAAAKDGACPGYALVLHRSEDAETAQGELRRLWCALPPENGVWLSREAAKAVAPYVRVQDRGSSIRFVGPSYRDDASAGSAPEFALRRDDVTALSQVFGDAFTADGVRLVYVRYSPQGESSVPVEDAFAELGYSPGAFPVLGAGVANPRPYEAFIDTPLARLEGGLAERLTPNERVLLERSRAAFGILAGVIRPGAVSNRLMRGMDTYLTLCVRAYVREMASRGLPAVLAFRNFHRVSKESADFVTKLVESGENLCIVCASENPPPPSWGKFDFRLVEVGPSGSGDYREAAGAVDPEAPLESLWKLSSSSPLDLYKRVFLWNRGLKKAALSKTSFRSQLLALLPAEASLLLYACGACGNILDGGQFSEFMGRLGLLPPAYRLLRDLLHDRGFLERGSSEPAYPVAPEDFPETSRAGREAVDDALAEHLAALYRQKRVRPSLGLVESIRRSRRAPGDPERILAFECALDDTVISTDGSASSPGTAWSELGFDPYALRDAAAALERSDRDACLAALDRAERAATDREFGAAVLELLKADFAYASKDAPTAADCAKRALLHLRHTNAPRPEAFALRLLGMCALAQERAVEAIEYFSSAYDVAESSRQDRERLLSAWFAACGHFLRGDYARASRHAELAQGAARSLCLRDWESWLDFFQGRLHFEAGDYEEAIRRFSEARCGALVNGLEGAERRCVAWTARARGHLGEFEAVDAVLASLAGDAEAALFRGELRLLAGNHAEAAALLAAVPPFPPRSFAPAEAIAWDSAFAGVEGRGPGFGKAATIEGDYLKALRLFARGMADPEPERATALFAMTREERIAEDNPFAMLYFLFCFLALERLETPPIDRATVLSRAYRLFQERSSRIDDHALRSSFQERNVWTRRLVDAAKTYKFF